MLVFLLIFIYCCLKDLLQRARITNAKNRSPAEQHLSSKDHRSPAQQQQQREALRQLAAEHGNYDTAGNGSWNRWGIYTFNWAISNIRTWQSDRPGPHRDRCASSCSINKMRTKINAHWDDVVRSAVFSNGPKHPYWSLAIFHYRATAGTAAALSIPRPSCPEGSAPAILVS